MTAAVSWLAYAAYFLQWLFVDQEASVLWPASVAVAGIGLGVALTRTERYRSIGLGMAVGVGVAAVMATIYTVVGLAALAKEIGPDAGGPAGAGVVDKPLAVR